MTIPKEIVEKMEQVNALMLEVDKWLYENANMEGSRHNCSEFITGNFKHTNHYSFTSEPSGEEQNDGEYCDQWSVGESGDSFNGMYYYPTEKGNYFYFEYWL